MSDLSPEYLSYPLRRYGMDHTLYEWSMLRSRTPLVWPDGKTLALVVVPVLEWFPLDQERQPIAPPSGLSTPYPDLRHYSLRDYGNRVGIYRLLKLLDELSIPASVAVQASVAKRYPLLVEELANRRFELVGHGVDMGHLHAGAVQAEEEARFIRDSLATLRAFGAVQGWLSPGRLQSPHTLDLITQAGLSYTLDLANDELPYPLTMAPGHLWSMPLSPLLSDRSVIVEHRHTELDFADAVIDHFDFALRESNQYGARMMTVTIHPWVSGQPHRIGALEVTLRALARKNVWITTFREILSHIKG